MAVFRGNTTTTANSTPYITATTIESFFLTNISATNLVVTVRITDGTNNYYIYKGTINAGSTFSLDIPIRLKTSEYIRVENITTTQTIYYYFTIR